MIWSLANRTLPSRWHCDNADGLQPRLPSIDPRWPVVTGAILHR